MRAKQIEVFIMTTQGQMQNNSNWATKERRKECTSLGREFPLMTAYFSTYNIYVWQRFSPHKISVFYIISVAWSFAAQNLSLWYGVSLKLKIVNVTTWDGMDIRYPVRIAK